MGKESKRFLWSLLGIVLLFFTVQNFAYLREAEKRIAYKSVKRQIEDR